MTTETIFISIGTDCSIADALKKYNLRYFSLPFDWVVTYNGVTDIIVNKFDTFLPNPELNLSSHTRFIHNTFPNDYDKMNRRINRFMELLTSEKQLIFIRKGHYIHHHNESEKYNCVLKNDLQDSYDLEDHLKITYPKIKFKIICVLCCEKCFQSNTPLTKDSENIEIYNIAKKITCQEKDIIFNETIKKILKK